jgi:hypothetical protein
MNVELIFRLIYAAFGFLVTAIPAAITLVAIIRKKCKLSKELATATDEAVKAQIEANNAAATTEMLGVCNTLIENAEALYAGVSALFKQEGKSAGAMKKDSVMSKLQAYAIEHNYKFNADFWNAKIDEIVGMTRNVNASNK